MKFDSTVWGPHYWFFIHTVAHSYPIHPNEVTKRKYYDLMQNMPLFIPNEEVGDKFSKILDRYPVSPYLDNRESFIRWTNFIHNKINVSLGKEELSYSMSLDKYKSEYKPKTVFFAEKMNMRKHYVHIAFILICVLFIYMFY